MKQNYLTKKEIESIKKKAEKYADLFDEITYVLSEEKMNYIIDLDECINKLKDDNELDLSIKAHLLHLKNKELENKMHDIALQLYNNYTRKDKILDKYVLNEYNRYYDEISQIEYQIKDIDYKIYKLKHNE